MDDNRDHGEGGPFLFGSVCTIIRLFKVFRRDHIRQASNRVRRHHMGVRRHHVGVRQASGGVGVPCTYGSMCVGV